MLQAATGKICGCGGRLSLTVIFLLSFEEPFIVNENERCKFVSAPVDETPLAHLINCLIGSVVGWQVFNNIGH